MKIAIISDIHDNIPNLEKFLDWAKKNKIQALIVCGDLAAPGTLVKVLAPGFKGRIHLVFGNVADPESEMEKAKDFENVIHYGDLAEFELDGKSVAVVHFPEQAKELAKSKKYEIVFYGHSHMPWIEEIGQTFLVNPGTLGGLFNKATFAWWDTGNHKLELKILEEI